MPTARSELNPLGLAYSFDQGDVTPAPRPTTLSHRKAYYHLVNVEEHPEILPLARDHLLERLEQAWGGGHDLAAALAPLAEDPGAQAKVEGLLTELRARFAHPWRHETEDLTRRQVLHYFMQYMPTAFVDGCWLQCGLRVSTAHTRAGAALTGLYAHQVRAFNADPGRHFVADYRAVYQRLGAPLEEVSSRSFAQRRDFMETSFGFPILLMSVAQFPRAHVAELLGLNLAWHFLDLSAFGPELVRETCRAYALPSYGDDLGAEDYLDRGREMASTAVTDFLAGTDARERADVWRRVVRGAALGAVGWAEWFEHTRAAAPDGPPDPRQEMIDLLWRKAPHARGYHADKKLGDKKIDDHLDQEDFDGPAILAELARSPWVRPGASDRSQLLKGLVEFGGPMLAVFSPVELQIIQEWIDGLPPKGSNGSGGPADTRPTPQAPTQPKELTITGRAWTHEDLARRSETRFADLSTRELYHHLINAEFFPDILPVAERFARDRLERSMAMLFKGERPIPSRRYDPEALERWVYKKHREQVDSYRPPGVRPDAPREPFVEATVQLAPLILIDGGWLQGMASPALIHTTVGRMLFHVLVEEIGEGNPDEHHANIYRDLLAAMGEDAPPVESMEFARWPRLRDESFEVPTLWLSISCFPRHFLPEIIGLNLAVELAGIGGPYMEARDTLRRFGYPTLFVDVHNAADNVSVGHAAWAMNAIKRYIDGVAEREGPHGVDHAWHRVWTGVRATLPQIGRVRLIAHRIARRLFAEDPRLVPLIFPS